MLFDRILPETRKIDINNQIGPVSHKGPVPVTRLVIAEETGNRMNSFKWALDLKCQIQAFIMMKYKPILDIFLLKHTFYVNMLLGF